MGKGSRNRNDRFQDGFSNPEKQIKTKGKRNWLGTITFSILAIILVTVMVVTTVASSGCFIRNKTAASGQTIEVDGAMMTYFFKSYYNTWLSQYGYYYMSQQQPLISLRLDSSLKNQEYGKGMEVYLFGSFKGTWFDFFANATVNQVKTYVSYCEAAKVEGMKLDKEDFENIDAVIDSYKTAARQDGKSLSQYLSIYFGQGVKEKDVRKCLELERLAAKYYEKKSDENKNAIKDEDITDYFNNNLDKFVTAGYLNYVITSELGKEPQASDYKDGEKSEEYIAAKKAWDEKKAAHDKKVSEFLAYELSEATKDIVLTAIVEKEFETLYNKYVGKLETKPTADEKKNIKKEICDAMVAALKADGGNTEGGASTQAAGDKITVDEFKNLISNDLNALKDEMKSSIAPAEFRAKIIETVVDNEFEAIYKKYADKLNKDKVPTEEEKIAFKQALRNELVAEYCVDKAADDTTTSTDDNKESTVTTVEDLKKSVKKDVKAKVESTVKAAVKDEYAFNSNTELGAWLFEGIYKQFGIDPTKLEVETTEEETGTETTTSTTTEKEEPKFTFTGLGENAKLFEIKTITEINSSGKCTSTVYIVTKEPEREEYLTKDVAHLLVSIEKAGETATDAEKAAAKKKAEQLLAEFKKGEITKEAFEKFAEGKTADSGVVYEGVTKGQMVASFNDWIYDEARKPNDMDIVETTYGYHIMFFIGDGEAAWKVGAKEGQHQKANDKFFKGITEKYKVEVDMGFVNGISA